MNSQPLSLVLQCTNNSFFDPDTTYFTNASLKTTEIALRCITSSILVPTLGLCGVLWHTARAITCLPDTQTAKLHCVQGWKDLVYTIQFLPVALHNSIYITIVVATIHLRMPVVAIASSALPALIIPTALTSDDVLKMLRQLQMDRMVDPEPILIPQVRRMRHRLAQQRIDLHSNTWQLRIKRSNLIHDPDSVIDSLARVQYSRAPLAHKLNIDFDDELGIDQKGLSRDFLSILFQSVTCRSTCFSFKQSPLGAMPLIHPASPNAKYRFLTDTDFDTLSNKELFEILLLAYRSRIPREFFQHGKVIAENVKDKFTTIINQIPPLPETEQLGYEVLGKFMSMAENDPRLVIGLCFHQTVFDLLCAMNYDEIAIDFTDVSDQTLLTLYEIKEQNDPVIQKMYKLQSKPLAEIEKEFPLNDELLYYLYPEGNFPEHFATKNCIKENFDIYQDALRQRLLILARQDRSLPAIHAICKGMRKIYSETEWERLQQGGGQFLSREIQGTLSKKDVKRFFSCENPKIQRYFEQWFGEATIKQLSQFLQAATGASTVCQALKVEPGDDLRRYPAFHTCNGQIDVPRYETYAEFKDKFDKAISIALNSGFTLG